MFFPYSKKTILDSVQSVDDFFLYKAPDIKYIRILSKGSLHFPNVDQLVGGGC